MKARGVTLVEVIIATTVTVIVGSLLLSILVNNTGLFYQQSSRLNQGLGLNDSMAKIRSAVKEANAVAGGYPIVSPVYTSGATALVLRLPAIDSSGNKIFNVFDYGVFTVSQNRLYFKVYPDTANGSIRETADQVLTNNVDSVNFEYFDSAGLAVTPASAVRVRVTLTLKQKAGKGYETNIATSEANLRND
ncbi:MAG: Uncharacterized protein CEO21_428 [Microgenomates group bacterium Gr01-1014_80]|nr:MAG: Uncharacterized protein CEO21_428 [Microgenomates group bacterium Gr01-1014_80]